MNRIKAMRIRIPGIEALIEEMDMSAKTYAKSTTNSTQNMKDNWGTVKDQA